MFELHCYSYTVLCYLMQYKYTPLHIAAQKDHKEVIRILLDHGANPNVLAAVSLYLLHTHTTHLRQWIDYPDC